MGSVVNRQVRPPDVAARHELRVDARTARCANTNIVQLVEGRLLRITTAGDDAARIISVGPIKQNGLFNGIVNGRFVPLVE